MSDSSSRRAVVTSILAPLALISVLTACGGGDGVPSATERLSTAREGGADKPATATSSGADAVPKRAGEDKARTSARVLPAPRDIIFRGSITVEVKDVADSAARVERISTEAGGQVFNEETTSRAGPETDEARLTLRVPPEEFRSVLRKLAAIGKRLRQTQTAEDVTTQVVDTDSRIASQRRSIARVRQLLDRANSIGDIVQLESELARREADLGSLESQRARLKDLTAMATIEVSLIATKGSDPKRNSEDEELGFLAGLRDGWNAFVQIVLVALTVLGALLPFGLAGALVVVPTWFLLRSRLRLRRGQTAPQVPGT